MLLICCCSTSCCTCARHCSCHCCTQSPEPYLQLLYLSFCICCACDLARRSTGTRRRLKIITLKVSTTLAGHTTMELASSAT